MIEQRAECVRTSILVCRGCGAWRPVLAPVWEGWRYTPPPAGDWWVMR